MRSCSRPHEPVSLLLHSIIAKDNTLLGGINMVDHGPFQGDYTGVNVQGNNIRTENAMIKIGIAVGLMTWGTYNDTSFRTHGGNIAGNSFSSAGGAGYFGYGMWVARHGPRDHLADSSLFPERTPATITPLFKTIILEALCSPARSPIPAFRD